MKNIDKIRHFLAASRRAHAIPEPLLRMIIIVPHTQAHAAFEAALVEVLGSKSNRAASILCMKITARREAAEQLDQQRDG